MKPKYKIMIQNSGKLWIQWGGNYPTKQQAEQAARGLRYKFQEPFWRAYYTNLEPKVIEINKHDKRRS